MSRALVLGGGGVSGIAWEVGVLTGLAEAGIDVADWNLVVGTSAGSIVGARLLGDGDLDAFYATQADAIPASMDDWVRTIGGRLGASMLIAGRRRRLGWLPRLWLTGIGLETLVRRAARRRRRRRGPAAASGPRVISAPNPSLAQVGALALAARTAPEAHFVSIVEELLEPVRSWPARLAVTAVDALTGEGVVFDATSDVPLARAVAASCSLPAIMPPVTLGGRPYVDGGVASEVHLDLAAEHDEVLAIVPLDLGRVQAEAAALRAAGTRVDLIVPSDAGRTAVGRNIALLDPDRRSRAARVGREDGLRAARALRPALTA